VALFQPVATRFLEALARSLPGRRPEELLMGFHFMVGMLVHSLMGNIHRDFEQDPDRARISDEALIQRMVAFSVAGFRSGRLDAGESAQGAEAGEGSQTGLCDEAVEEAR